MPIQIKGTYLTSRGLARNCKIKGKMTNAANSNSYKRDYVG